MAPTASLIPQVTDVRHTGSEEASIAQFTRNKNGEMEVEDMNYVSRETRRGFPRPPQFRTKLQERAWIKFRLAQAFRIFGRLKYDEGVAGHITFRDPVRTDCFWVNPFGVHYSLIQPEDLLLVDHDGNVQEGSGPHRLINTSAFMIHSEIHRMRPGDADCAAHTHSPHGRAFSTFGKELDMITQDSCAYYKDHAVYKQFNGVVMELDEGTRIAAALGDKKAVILQNHGLLVVNPTIEATVFFYMTLERVCRVQLMADAAAAAGNEQTKKIGDEEAEFTYKTFGTPRAGWFSAMPEFELLEALEGVKFDFERCTEVTFDTGRRARRAVRGQQ